MALSLHIPDLHFPYHDARYCMLALRLIRVLQPDYVIQYGDAIDCPQLSTYDKNPARMNRFYQDVALYNDWLDRVGKAMKRGSIFHQLEGNHEKRLSRYVWRTAPEVAEIMPAWPDLLKIRERNTSSRVAWEWHPYEKWDSCSLPGNVVCHHGFYYDKHTAMNNLTRYAGVNFIQGHTHRVQYASNGRVFSAVLGFGAKHEGVAHQPTPADSQQAIGIVRHGKQSTLEIIHVNNGKAIVNGKLYTSS